MVELDGTEDLVREILCRLPVKSLTRFKSVSKSWCALFQNPRFAHDHLIITRKRGRPRLLINKINFSRDDQNIRMRILMLPHPHHHDETILPADDHIIKYSSSQLVDLTQIFGHSEAAVSSLVPSNIWSFRVCSNGLICFFDGTSSRVALANMATREFKLLPRLPLPQSGLDDDDEEEDRRTTSLLVVPLALAFHHSNFSSSSSPSPDYTIFFGRRIMKEDLVRVQYATYAASTNSWTEITETPPPNMTTSSHHLFTSLRDSAFINGVYYWVWFRYSRGAEIMILTFDVQSRVFREAQGPLTSYPTIANLSLFEHRNGVWLAVSYEVDHHSHLHQHPLFCHDVWVMMDGGDGGWKKQFTVGPLFGMNRMLRLWSNNGRADDDLAVLASVSEQVHLYDPLNGEMVMDLTDMEVDGAAGKIIDAFTYEESVVKLS